MGKKSRKLEIIDKVLENFFVIWEIIRNFAAKSIK